MCASQNARFFTLEFCTEDDRVSDQYRTRATSTTIATGFKPTLRIIEIGWTMQNRRKPSASMKIPFGRSWQLLSIRQPTVFSMHAGSPRINVSDGGRLKTDSRINGAAHFALAFADDTHVESDGQAEYRSRKSDVRNAFNSPFWPFVLATTSVGQEGLDFHLYCKDIVHWNLPSNPVDLEQREGRLNRFNSLAIREMIAKDHPLQSLSMCSTPSDTVANQGLPWQWTFDEIYSQPLSQQMFKQGLFPHWVYSPRDGKMEILRRHLMFYSNSRDVQKYKQLKRDLSIYRLVFGQPRQEDVVRKIRENLGGEVSDELLNQFLPIYMINLSPFDSKDVWQAAQSEAAKIIKNAATLTQFIGVVETFVAPRNAELQEVKEDIANLLRIAEQATLGVEFPSAATLHAVAALYYLINPYDEIYDFHTGVGFKDDIELIKRVSAELLLMET